MVHADRSRVLPVRIRLEDFVVDGEEYRKTSPRRDVTVSVAQPLVARHGAVRSLGHPVRVAVLDEAALVQELIERPRNTKAVVDAARAGIEVVAIRRAQERRSVAPAGWSPRLRIARRPPRYPPPASPRALPLQDCPG